MTYIDDIRRLRKDAKIDQKNMAKRVGLKQSAYNRLETGKTEMKVSMLQSIVNALGKRLHIAFIDKDEK